MSRADILDVPGASVQTVPLDSVLPVGATEREFDLRAGSAVTIRSSTLGGWVQGVVTDKKGSLVQVAYHSHGRVLMKVVSVTDVTPIRKNFTENTDASHEPRVAEVPNRDREAFASRTNNASENTDSMNLSVSFIGLPLVNTKRTVSQDTAANVKTGVSMTVAALPELYPQGDVGLPIANTESAVCQDTAASVKTGVSMALAALPEIYPQGGVCLPIPNAESTGCQETAAASVKTGVSRTLTALAELHPQGSEAKSVSVSVHADKKVHSRPGHRLDPGSEGPCEFSVRKLHEVLTGTEAHKVQAIDLRSMRLEYIFSCLPGARHVPIEGFADQMKRLATEFACSSSMLVLYNRESLAYQTKLCAERLSREMQGHCLGSQCQVRFFGGDIDEWEDYWRCELYPGSQVLIRYSGSGAWSRGSVVHVTGDRVAVSSGSGFEVINLDSNDLMLALPEP